MSMGRRALNPLMLATEAEVVLRTCDTTGVRAKNDCSDGVIDSIEVISAEGLLARAAAELTEGERFGPQARKTYEHGEHVEPRRPIAPRRQAVPRTSVAAERPLPLAGEGVVREVVVAGKRWRGP
jgi:hypothetical protein